MKRNRWRGTVWILLFSLFIVVSCNNSKNTKNKQENKQLTENGMPPGPFNGDRPTGMPPGPPPGGEKPEGMPPGPPPNGNTPEGMPPGGMGERFDVSLIKAVIGVKKGTKSKNKKTIKASGENESAVASSNEANVELGGNNIVTSGNTTSHENSSFQGLNAAVLARDKSTIRMKNNTITTTGEGANAIFAYGQSVIYTDSDVIDCTARGAHAIMSSGGGTIIAKNVNMITRGMNSGAVATDRGSGTIAVEGGTIKTTGADSPGIYSTGEITVSDANVIASGSEVAVIEGSNSIILNNSDLRCSFQNKWGVMIYQSFSGDAEGVDGHFEVNGGSLICEDKTGPMFFVTNSNANIFLNGTKLHQNSGILLRTAATDRWGHKGANGGKANITTNNQLLNGELIADKYSSIKLSLTGNSTFKGSINTGNKAEHVTVEIDSLSSWILTKDSYVNEINANISGKEITNIIGNGHMLYYSKKDCKILEGKTYNLKNGGKLKAL